MASVDTGTNNPNDPNNPNNLPGNVSQPGGQTNQPATTGGAGGVTSTGAGNVTGQVVGTANPSQPFQNISSYLAANATGGQQLAEQVAGTVSQPITQAQTGITNAAQDFTKSVNAGYAPENKDLISAVAANPAYVVAENPDNVTNFLGQLNNKYTGPTDFAQEPGYADIQAQIAKAQSAAANTQNEAGIQQLLGSVEGPTTAGINKLDSLLLSADPNNTKTIQDAGKGAANLLPTLNQTTADQNALATTGATSASQTAAKALEALNQARGTESTNLTNEQNSIQDIVNQYNKSVGVISPVVDAISSAISDFFANNPNVKMPNSGDPLADIRNLTSIVMPELATYASPEDYAQIAALTQLGDRNVGNLPIGSATANQAQTFNVPQALQDAIGKAPGVEKALESILTGVGTQINDAVTPFTQAEEAAYNYQTYGAPAEKAVQGDQGQIGQLNAELNSRATPPDDRTKAFIQQQIAELTADLQKQQQIVAANPAATWESVAPIAQGLQWVNGTETSYQQLIDAINAQLGKLGGVGAPTLAYGPSAMKSIEAGAPIGKEVGNTAAVGTGAGTAAAAGAGAVGSGTALAAADVAAQTGMTLAESQAAVDAAATTGGNLGFGALSAVQAAGPAALAAYGTSNIVQNSIANPVQAGLMTAANMGLSLATLSIPPKYFTSIGKDIKNVISDIGNWFGGLF